MKQKELKKRIDEFMTMLSENGYSSHVIVVKDKQLASVGAAGDIADVINGFAGMFSDAVNDDSPRMLRIVCSAISSIVLQHQQLALDSLFGLDDEDDEGDCEHCEKSDECMNRGAIERRNATNKEVN